MKCFDQIWVKLHVVAQFYLVLWGSKILKILRDALACQVDLTSENKTKVFWMQRLFSVLIQWSWVLPNWNRS